MAAPAAVLAVKAALVATTDQRARTAVLSVVAAVLTPFILIIVVLLCTLSGTANHNNAAVDLTFHGGYLSSEMPAEYRMYIEKMRESFADLDEVLTEINGMCEDGTVDDYRVKAIFYALYFAAEQPDTDGIHAFADCFVDYEERTRTVTTTDEEGNEVETTETYMVAIPVEDLAEIYERISDAMGVEITADHQANADSIYNLILYGSPSGGNSGWFPGAPAEETAAGSLGLMSHSLGWMASALPSEQAGSPWSPRNSGTAATPSPAKRGDTLEWIWQYQQALLSGPHCLGRSQFPNITAAMVTM